MANVVCTGEPSPRADGSAPGTMLYKHTMLKPIGLSSVAFLGRSATKVMVTVSGICPVFSQVRNARATRETWSGSKARSICADNPSGPPAFFAILQRTSPTASSVSGPTRASCSCAPALSWSKSWCCCTWLPGNGCQTAFHSFLRAALALHFGLGTA